MTAEDQLGAWAARHGIDFSLARTQLLPGDAEQGIAQLRHAKEHKSQADVDSVVTWLRLLEERACNQV